MTEEIRGISPSKPVYVVKKRSIWPWIIGGIIVFGLLVILSISLSLNVTLIRGEGQAGIIPSARPRVSEFLIEGEGKAKIAVIPVEGIIGFSRGGGIWGKENLVRQVSAALARAEEDEEVEAVILRINSPGGGITASDVLHQRVKDFKEGGKKVVSLFGDVAASGAYYLAAPSDLIVAHPTTVTGSFGVIIQSFNLEGLMRKIGVGDVTIKAGEQKDLLSPFRSLSPEEKKLLQGVVDEMHERFIRVIAEGRKLDGAKVREYADGRIFTASGALERELVDEIGYEKDAIRLARHLAGRDEARVVEYRAVSTFWDLLRSQIGNLSPRSQISRLGGLLQPSSPRLLYLWQI